MVNPKEVCESINQEIGKLRNNVRNDEIDNTLASDPIIIANKFNDFFTSIGRNLSINHVDVPNFEMYSPLVQNNVRFTVTPVSEEEIQKVFSCLKTKRLDKMIYLLSYFAETLIFFNYSLQTL